MGGRTQGRPNGVHSRYNPELICAKINSCRDIRSACKLRDGSYTCLDFARLFEPGVAAFYLDPPYSEKGPDLYQFSFTHEDHVRLAALLRKETRPWLLSYDNHPVIIDHYQGWSRIE
jgi:DNA adenine methylase